MSLDCTSDSTKQAGSTSSSPQVFQPLLSGVNFEIKPQDWRAKHGQRSQPAPLPHTLQAQGSSDGWGKWSPTKVKPCLAKTGSRVNPLPQLVGWSDVSNQAVLAQPTPVPPTNEVINTYFVSCAIDSSSSVSREKNPILCEQVTEL